MIVELSAASDRLQHDHILYEQGPFKVGKERNRHHQRAADRPQHCRHKCRAAESFPEERRSQEAAPCQAQSRLSQMVAASEVRDEMLTTDQLSRTAS